jgi:transglutaminase/protease-like cytokinesis protein 3
MSSIENHFVRGTADGVSHGWNKVKIDGEYYNIDVTYDDPVTKYDVGARYQYFLVTDDELRKDHSWNDASNGNLPEATGQRARFYTSDNVVQDFEGLLSHLMYAIATHETTFNVTITGAAENDYDDNMTEINRISTKVLRRMDASYNKIENNSFKIIFV